MAEDAARELPDLPLEDALLQSHPLKGASWVLVLPTLMAGAFHLLAAPRFRLCLADRRSGRRLSSVRRF